MFATRLNALVAISGATNTMLGRAVGLDSSYIGRLRNGKRRLPKAHDFLVPMCEYLVRRLSKGYQFTALSSLTGIMDEALPEHELAQRLVVWLTEKDDEEIAAAEHFIRSFSHIASGRPNAPPPVIAALKDDVEPRLSYFGNSGKRSAVERFFLEILREDKPQTLLLFSDESFAWLYEDAAFAQRWLELFRAVLLRHNSVKIAHTVSRSIDEMLIGVSKWLPIYMTGAVKPYYDPQQRDGPFQRTLFIAPNTAAILSSSVRQEPAGMLNLYLKDPKDVAALTCECRNFFSVCRPLMQIYQKQQREEFFQNAAKLSSADGDAVYYSAMPPLFALPEEAARHLSEQSKLPNLYPLWRQSMDAFALSMNARKTTAMILSPRQALHQPARIRLPICEMLLLDEAAYTPELYARHVANLLWLEQRYDRLTVVTKDAMPDHVLLYAKEDTGALVVATTAPNIAFSIDEKRMVNAFWEYLNAQI